MNKSEILNNEFSERSQLVILCILLLVFIATAIYRGFFMNFILINIVAGIVCGGFLLAHRKTKKKLFLISYVSVFFIVGTKLENIDLGFTQDLWSTVQGISLLGCTVQAIGLAHTRYLRNADVANLRVF